MEEVQAPVLAEVKTRRRLAAWLDMSGMGTVLILLDVLLSIVTVGSYIISTYGIGLSVLWYVDFFCACFFAACFFLNLWLSDERYAYLMSWNTLVDILTIIPPLVLAFVRIGSVTSDVTTAAAINFLRVLRLVRIIKLLEVGARMAQLRNSDVVEAMLKLVLSVICMLVLGAGAFYELERSQPKYASDITYHASIYWAAVTLTTVGYGDFSPSWALTQMLIIVYLCMTFTVLPYLTGNVVNALNASTTWQRSRQHSSSRQHMVLLGHIGQEVSWKLADEVFHEDKGFAEQNMVLLADGPPTPGMRIMLNRHRHASKIKYLQGSPFVPYDLERALLEYAGGVFILADVSSPCPAQADLQTIMTALAVGEYLQHRRLALERQLTWMGQRLLNRILLRPTHVPQTLPRVVVQLLLPESVQQLQRTLTSLTTPPPSCRRHPAPSDSFSCQLSRSPTNLQSSMSSSGRHAKEPTNAAASQGRHGPASALSALKAPAEAVTAASRNVVTIVTTTMAGAVQQALQLGPDVTPHMLVGCRFWSAFQNCLEVVCVQEVEQALMCHSALGVPGVVTLLHNLVVTRDVSPPLKVQLKLAKDATSSNSQRKMLADAHVAAQPPWLATYLRGASMELYLLAAFPPALWGLTYTQAARFIYDRCQQAVVLSVTVPGCEDPLVAPTHLVIGQGMGAHLICEDLLAIGDVFDSTAQEVADWAAENAIELPAARGSKEPAGELQLASANTEGTPFDEEQPAPFLPKASSSNRTATSSSSGRLPAALHSLLPNRSFGSDSSEQQRKKRRRAKGNVVVVQPLRSAGQTAGFNTQLPQSHASEVWHNDQRLLRSSTCPAALVSQEASYNSRYHLLPPDAMPINPGDLVVTRVTCSSHLLVVGVGEVSMHSIASLLLPFRSRLLPHQPDIVVVIHQLPSLQSGWAQLAALPKVQLVMAGPTTEDTLSRAGAAAAGRVLLLAGKQEAAASDEGAVLVQSTLQDAVIMDLYHQVRAVNPWVLMVTELRVDAACSFLSPLDPLLAAGREDPAFLTPAFMAGQVMLVRLVDYLALQAYQVPGSMRLLLQLIRGWRGLTPTAAPHRQQQPREQVAGPAQQQQAEHTRADDVADEAFNSCSSHLEGGAGSAAGGATQAAAGLHHAHAPTAAMAAAAGVDQGAVGAGGWDRDVCSQGLPSSGSATHSSKLGGSKGVTCKDDMPTSGSGSGGQCMPTLVQLTVSPDQEGMPYGDLYHQLLVTRGILLLGLYRPVQHQSAVFDCVLTNPQQDTVVTASDHLFVVAPVRGGHAVTSRRAAAAAWPHDMAWWT